MVKVMFLAAAGRPCFDLHKNQFFDGKPEIRCFIVKRNTENRHKGTWVIKSIELNKGINKIT